MSDLSGKYKKLKKQRIRNIIFNSLCAIITMVGALWGIRLFWRYYQYEITNDAFVDQLENIKSLDPLL